MRRIKELLVLTIAFCMLGKHLIAQLEQNKPTQHLQLVCRFSEEAQQGPWFIQRVRSSFLKPKVLLVHTYKNDSLKSGKLEQRKIWTEGVITLQSGSKL